MLDQDVEPDFIEFDFGTAEKATLAERAFPLYAVLGTSIAIRSALVDELGDQIRGKLKELGLEWTESASSLTEEDMWPSWPEDAADEEEEPSSPMP